MTKVVIASQNQHKIQEINHILKLFNMEGVPLSDVGLGHVNIIEDGETFEENSYIKAKAILDITKEITLADDSGLEVDALDGAPGVYSARYAGEDASDDDNNKKLLEELKDVPQDNRGAQYVCVITMLYPDGRKLVARGEVKGRIDTQASGTEGFGYDPYFIPAGYDHSFGCFTMDEKNKISHRGKALEKLKSLIEKESKSN